MVARCQAVPVDLEAMTEAGLHHTIAPVNLQDEPADIAQQFGLDTGDVIRYHRT